MVNDLQKQICVRGSNLTRSGRSLSFHGNIDLAALNHGGNFRVADDPFPHQELTIIRTVKCDVKCA